MQGLFGFVVLYAPGLGGDFHAIVLVGSHIRRSCSGYSTTITSSAYLNVLSFLIPVLVKLLLPIMFGRKRYFGLTGVHLQVAVGVIAGIDFLYVNPIVGEELKVWIDEY